MLKENKCCKTCKYHDDWTWACFNPEAEDGSDFTDESYVCECWESNNVQENI